MCLVGEEGFCELHQVAFGERPFSNAAFFQQLKTEYKAQRTPGYRWWQLSGLRERKVSEIHFVEFGTLCPEPAQEICITAQPGFPVDEEGWACGLATTRSQVPPDPKLLASRLHGLNLHREGYSLYDLVPRKLESALPRQGGLKGWGLYFVETTRWKVWEIRVLMLSLALIALGISFL